MDFAERAARNEEIFREVNQRIAEGADQHRVETPLPFHCECLDAVCVEKIEIAPGEFDRIATDPARFVVVSGHQREGIERVAERHPSFLVVEKLGEAREQIKRDHPRVRHRKDDSPREA